MAVQRKANPDYPRNLEVGYLRVTAAERGM